MQRPGLLLAPGLIAIALFAGISTFESSSTESVNDAPSRQPDYDAWSEGIATTLYDDSGAIGYTLQAVRQVHYRDGHAELEQPSIHLYRDGAARWHVVAEQGRITAAAAGEDTDPIIELTGNVRVNGIDEFGNPMRLSTTFLSVDPRLETVETDHRVTLASSNLQQSAVGMFADFRNDEMVFHRDIKGSYEPVSN